MPFTAQQIITGSTYTLASYQRTAPVDQINVEHVALDWLVKNKKPSNFGNGSFKEPVFYQNSSNYQNYSGADQVTYNERDPAKWTDFSYYSNHDGFWFDEDRLIANGIHLSDDGESSMPTQAEKDQLINLLDTSYTALKAGIQEQMAFELYRDGSQSTKACPGFEHIVDWTPAVGTVGGIDSATYTWWQNNASLAIAADTNLLAGTNQMEAMWRACRRYGGVKPNKLICGAAFLDAFRKNAAVTVSRQLNDGGNSKGGVSIDPSLENVYFHGIPLEWDPTLEALDTLLGTTTRTKTCYMLNDTRIRLRPLPGEWMRNRKADKMPDRYVYYFGQTSKYGLTSDKRNALAVLQIA